MTTLAPPSEFLCPITMELMVYPMATRYGGNYEREAIFAWLAQGKNECPMTRRPLQLAQLINNNSLAAEIQKWCQDNGVQNQRSASVENNDPAVDHSNDSLEHIFGTSPAPYKAVTLAPNYYKTKKSKSSSHPSSSSPSKTDKSSKSSSKGKVGNNVILALRSRMAL